MYTGYEREISLILPLGEKEHDYKFSLIVTVEDQFSYGVSETFQVKVRNLVCQ